MENDYRKYYLNKPTEILLQAYNDTSGKYNPEVFSKIEEILVERNVDFEKKDNGNNEKNIEKDHPLSYLPLGIGILGIVLIIVTTNLNTGYSLAIFIGIIYRLFLILYVSTLCNENNLKKPLWITFVFYFGIWAIIAIKIAIKYKSEKNPEIGYTDPNSLLDFANENIINKAEVKKVDENNYTHCPACLKDMLGKNKCDDCNLEF